MRDWEAFVRRHLDLPAMTDRRDQRIVAELAAHAEEAFQESRSRGATQDEAEATALAALGSRDAAVPELLRSERHHAAAEAGRRALRAEDVLREKGSRWARLADLLMEFRLTLRTLGRSRLFTAVVVLVLALGIGATTAIFTLLDRIVISPLPFRDQDRLVSLGHVPSRSGGGDVGQCAAWHFTYLEENRVFQYLGMYAPGGTLTVMRNGEPEAVAALGATSGVFNALGTGAALGRVIQPADEDPDVPGVAMLSYDYWRTRFGGDPTVVGRTLQVDGSDREIIGVLPPSLSALGREASLVIPLRFRRADLFVGDVGFVAVARLREGVTRREALADMARMLPLAFEKFPGGPAFDFMREASFVPSIRPLKDALVGDIGRTLWVLMAGVILVLAVACANVANLFLVRADGKGKEMAVRAAMGASRSRIGWEYLKESLVLGALGGLVGLGLAQGGLKALVALSPARLPRVDEVSLSPTVLLFAVAVSIGAALFFGSFPALRRGRGDLAESLKQGGRAGSFGIGGRLTQSALAVAQIAMAVVLLVGSGLVFRSAGALRSVDPGFSHSDDVLALRLSLRAFMIPGGDAAAGAQMQESIARQLGEIAGVRSVGMATSLPMHPGGNINPLFVDGVTVAGERPPMTRRHKWVGEGYFETFGIPLLAGRTLTWQDAHDRAPIAVVSRGIAVAYWGSVDSAIGKRISVRPDPVRWHEVVGVVGDVREDGLGLDPAPMVYWPQVTLATWQGTTLDDVMLWGTSSYAVRSPRVGTPGFLEEVRHAVRSVHPGLALLAPGRHSEFVVRTVARTSFTLALMGIAGGVALILGVVGVFGVVAYGVSQRTLELGMRMVLGADGAQLKALVLRQALILAAVGVALGLALSLALTRVMSSLLFGVSPTDPLTFAVVAAGLTAAALAASYLPAYRASRVDPMVVLRAE